MQIIKQHHIEESVTSERLPSGNILIPVYGEHDSSAIAGLRGVQQTECPYPGYNPFAVEKSDLRTFPSYPYGDHLEVYGKVLEVADNVMLKNALLEIWHLSPNSSKYSHRAKLRINGFGEYRFITDFPGRAIGQNYKIYLKVTVGDYSYFHKLTFNNIQAYMWGRKSLHNNLSATALSTAGTKTSVRKTTIAFNLKLR